jgi:hypothetical protein
LNSRTSLPGTPSDFASNTYAPKDQDDAQRQVRATTHALRRWLY